ncbi:radical SAM/SPASM domain-containing protein [Aminipila terrae]|uniref:Radical SAM protein n=1 Tax=Aminipila terrae TaxID=2697030 RepID=A0A6P1MB85_9FIRM|nr:radical SAM protein [Aminipila terrae]QHI71949.1 radical SAM protein [Aminipila terrae]
MQDKTLKDPTPGGQRIELGAVLPLDTPFIVQIFPAYACNLKCGYCIHALDKKERGNISDVVYMDFELYKKCIDQMKSFKNKLKMLRFAAIGEPLIHKDIARMVEYAKQAEIAQSIDIVSNGTLLTRQLSDALIEAGLSKLRLSINGLSKEQYLKNTGQPIDFEKMVENISYFYENRGNTKLYIKIIDYMVDTKDEKEKFYNYFLDICDEIAIEHLTPTIEEINYKKLSGKEKLDKPHNEAEMIYTEICPQPFYLMQVNPDGNVVPCCSMKYPAVLGNIKEKNIERIWNGEKFNEFRRNLLHGVKNATDVCQKCNLYLYDMHKEDVLDRYVNNLLKGKLF